MIDQLIEAIKSKKFDVAQAIVREQIAARIGEKIEEARIFTSKTYFMSEESTHEWFRSLSSEQQMSYLKMHPKSELKKYYRITQDGKVVTTDGEKEAPQKLKPQKKDFSNIKLPDGKKPDGEKPVPETKPEDEAPSKEKSTDGQGTITLDDLKMKQLKGGVELDRTPAKVVKGKSAQEILAAKGSPTDMSGPDAESGKEGSDAEFERDLIAALSNLAQEGKEWKKRASEAAAGGKEFSEPPPTFELCHISVPGTNLFCGNNAGIPRKQMPQLSGMPEEGSTASSLPRSKTGEVSIEKQFKEQLTKDGIKTTPKKVDVATLKATQTQLDGGKVSAMLETLKVDPTNEALNSPIYVSKDGYILDGHHRWAALLALGIADGLDEPVAMNVVQVEMGIEDLVDYTNNYAKSMGIKQKVAGETTGNTEKQKLKEAVEVFGRDKQKSKEFVDMIRNDSKFEENPFNPRELYVEVGGGETAVVFEIVPFDGYVHISSIHTPPAFRGKGYASEIMKYLTDKADEYGVAMDLYPEPFGQDKPSKAMLKKFYKKFGFVQKRSGSDSMVRVPKR